MEAGLRVAEKYGCERTNTAQPFVSNYYYPRNHHPPTRDAGSCTSTHLLRVKGIVRQIDLRKARHGEACEDC